MVELQKLLFENKTEKKIGAGILFFAKDTKRFLILLRNPKVHKGNTWSTVGGKVEPGESAEEGAVRETREEIEFDDDIDLKPLYTFRKIKYNEIKKINVIFKYYTYLAKLDHEFKPKLNWENVDYKWVTLSELLEIEIKHPGLRELVARKHKLLRYLGK